MIRGRSKPESPTSPSRNNIPVPVPSARFLSKKKYANVETNTDEIYKCQKCEEREFLNLNDSEDFRTNYIKSINYINSCHGIMNALLAQKCLCSNSSSKSSKMSVMMPDLPNFLDVYSVLQETPMNSAASSRESSKTVINIDKHKNYEIQEDDTIERIVEYKEKQREEHERREQKLEEYKARQREEQERREEEHRAKQIEENKRREEEYRAKQREDQERQEEDYRTKQRKEQEEYKAKQKEENERKREQKVGEFIFNVRPKTNLMELIPDIKSSNEYQELEKKLRGETTDNESKTNKLKPNRNEMRKNFSETACEKKRDKREDKDKSRSAPAMGAEEHEKHKNLQNSLFLQKEDEEVRHMIDRGEADDNYNQSILERYAKKLLESTDSSMQSSLKKGL